ncbi:MAG: chromate transporter [Oscillospiraceae bacterium]|nr:chromate transporter [Oscillospiraceae bacterium]
MKKNLQLFWIFFKTSVVTVGGGLVMLPLIEREVVDKRDWISRDEILDIFAVAQTLPGMIIVKVAFYVGYKVGGIFGSLIAAFAVILPSLIAIFTVAAVLPAAVENVYVKRAFRGVTIGLSAMLLHLAFDLGRRTIKNWIGIVLLIVAIVAAVVLRINKVYIILFGAVAGLLIFLFKRGKENDKS